MEEMVASEQQIHQTTAADRSLALLEQQVEPQIMTMSVLVPYSLIQTWLPPAAQFTQQILTAMTFHALLQLILQLASLEQPALSIMPLALELPSQEPTCLAKSKPHWTELLQVANGMHWPQLTKLARVELLLHLAQYMTHSLECQEMMATAAKFLQTLIPQLP